ncbi:hypothetical protein GUITHDRAFT_153867 [Guillardia theta CCMP2712]|uniref:Uncharacterized protein n=1 Tax=Guillardia theta (strain CCMP2712) TaxID=905079 RepID=L1IYU9_GUITC|nr:hypothetical protein GUITHDRAFT_153867 [Guillardia theta CCMP2712]EKX41411.1 hypothetical protein GUITHDRAFT_153867 [Guillardia theta CCMP2712]|eukprot:XP_005828391.1 hypothetical protein GUITHDRAFT_153867 [Guillardia theta CCMP2712]
MSRNDVALLRTVRIIESQKVSFHRRSCQAGQHGIRITSDGKECLGNILNARTKVTWS